MVNSTYLNNVDEQKVQELLESTTTNATYFTDTVKKVVESYTGELDDLMYNIYQDIIKQESVPTISIERYYAELTSMLYFMGDRLEKLNVYNDMSKNAAREIFNKAYLDAGSEKDAKGKSIKTVNELTSIAESAAQYELVVNQLYDHAYKTTKQKVDAANEMVSTLKNILKKRISEDYINNALPDSNARLVEED